MASIKENFVPTSAKMMRWTTLIFNQGIRRPGYPADYWVENWVKMQFEAIGLHDIILDPVREVKKWEAYDAKLKIWLVNNPSEVIDIPCFPNSLYNTNN